MRLGLGENERWVSGYEGLYIVTNKGEVFSVYRGKVHKMKGGLLKDRKDGLKKGYRTYCLRKDGKARTHYAHRLVAIAFIPNPENKPCVNHKDGNKQNNNSVNLEWVTYSENSTHAVDSGLVDHYRLSQDDVRKRIIEAIVGDGNLSGRSFVTKEDLEDFNIPPEMIKLPLVKKNYLDTWNYYITLFRLCFNKKISGVEVSKIMGCSEAMISRVRKGSRAEDARRVFDKYRDNPYYFERYERVI